MLTYILRRLLLLLPVVLVVGVVTFALVHITPGDPARIIAGDEAPNDQVERVRAQLGLDRPLPVQFAQWLGRIARLDLGESFYLNQPVTVALRDRAQPTLLLTFYALTIGLLIAVPGGIIAALRRNTWIDRLILVLAISGTAVPSFFLAVLLILLFAVAWKVLPAGGYVDLQRDPLAHLRLMILPAFTLGFVISPFLSRVIRSSLIDVLHDDYIRTAMAKGLAQRPIILRHALRNALIPAVTALGTAIGALLGGAVVTETIFRLPGMGQLVVQSIQRRDFPVIQGAVMTIAAIKITVNLLVDVLYVYIDPRIRYGG